jgi:hypothetical protein
MFVWAPKRLPVLVTMKMHLKGLYNEDYWINIALAASALRVDWL